jgi:DNA-directed RNA polymerase beta' subunit
MDIEGAKDDVGGKKKIRYVFTPDLVYTILKNISDEDCMILGLDPKKTRPEDMILTIFPVPPVQMRPSIHGDFASGISSEDDLTRTLATIVKANERLKKTRDNPTENNTKYLDDHVQVLQYHVITYISSDAGAVPKSEQKGGKTTKSIESRLKSKEGRVRGNLMGKRGDFTGRTVITPDPTIGNNELGVPIKIAMNLTIPEIVRPDNIEMLTKLVRNGRDKYPGANFVFIASTMVRGKQNHPIDLRFRKEKIELKVGDIVERHLQNGDIVLLNRQPTLHKLSMMGHYIKVINDPNLLTFRMSVANCEPYNADFDGDEMNIFIPQSYQARLELEEIACVERQIISPATSKAITAIRQDGLLGSYLMTAKNLKIDWRTMMNLVSYTSFDDFQSFQKRAYTGNDLFSMIIPKKINMKGGGVKITNGIVEGQVTKGNCFGGNSLIKLVCDEYGMNRATVFVNDVQRLTNNFNLWHGFTAGLGDTFISEDVRDMIKKLILTKTMSVEHVITETENHPDLIDIETFDNQLLSEVGTVMEETGKLIGNNAKSNNGFVVCIKSGAKGEVLHLGKISGCIGLQTFEGRLIKKKYNHRISPYYHRDDDRAEARGFISNSFLSGLSFAEFCVNLLVGRSGSVDQAVKTAESGYLQHKMIKMLEDACVKYDSTVRTANDTLLQLIYGDSGVDTSRQYNYNFELLDQKYNYSGLKELLLFTKEEMSGLDYTEQENEEYAKKIIKMRNKLFTNIIKATMNHIIFENKIKIPVGIERIIENTVNNKEFNGDDKLEPKYVLEQLERIIRNNVTILTSISKKDLENGNSIKNDDINLHKTVFEFAIHDALNPKRSIIRLKLNKKKFDYIIGQIIDNYNRNMIEPGEMVGIVAGQSIGEPVTQMVINSVDATERIKILDTSVNVIKITTIGKLIDEILEAEKSRVFELKENPKEEKGVGYLLDIQSYNLAIQSIAPNGKITWKGIDAITKHKVINADRSSTILQVVTKSGKTIHATRGKSFLTRMSNQIKPIRGDMLRVGMYLPIGKFALTGAEVERMKQTEVIPGNTLKCICNLTKRFDLEGALKRPISDDDKKIIMETLNSDVIYDQIVSITEFEPTNGFVYDFTVEDNKTFCLANGMCCMDSFHVTGVASKSTTVKGLPRISELISVSKKQKNPQLTVYLNKEVLNDKDIVRKIASNLKYTSFAEIRGKVQVWYDPTPEEKDGLMEQDHVKHVFYNSSKSSCGKDINEMPWLIRIEMNREKMLQNEITLLDIKSHLCSWWERRYNDIKNMKKELKKVINKIIQIAVLSNSDSDRLPIIHIRFNAKNNDDDKFNMSTINDFITYIIDEFKLKGLNEIEDCDIAFDKQYLTLNEETGEIEKKSENYVITNGTNLIDIRYLTDIDLNRTISNDILEVYNTFGIEIARQVLLHEIMKAYAEASAGSINYQHFCMLIDLMTQGGNIMSIDRHGMNKTDNDVLTRASFEKTVEHVNNAAVYGETEHMRGVSARIMAGQVINGGTGFCNVFLDYDMVEKSEYLEEHSGNDKFVELEVPTIATDIAQQKEEDIFIP